MSTLWPEQHSEALRRHAKAGVHSYAQIAALINLEFRTRYSRNSAIGRAKRLGLLRENPRQNGVTGSKPKPTHVPPKPKPKPAIPAPSSPEAVQLRCVEVEPRLITIYELTDATCRWPYGDNPPLAFCGHPVLAGSYCSSHYFLSRRDSR